MSSKSTHYSSILNQYEDEVLFGMVKYLMMEKGGENVWFEAKKGGYPQQRAQLLKFPKIITSLSNTGGGLIYFGWDEQSNTPNPVQRDDLERDLLQRITDCEPVVPIVFHPINFESVSGLFVGIPAMDEPVIHRPTGSFGFRTGGHSNPSITADTLLKTQSQFLEEETGHIYNIHLEKIMQEILPKIIAEKINPIREFFVQTKQKIIDDIENNWEINFIQWLGDPPYNFPKRVRYDSWLPSSVNSKSQKLLSEILSEIQICFDLLNKVENNDKMSTHVETLMNLLRDTSRSKLNNPINHRTCLTTLISRENIWNFADARIFLNKNESGYYLQQNTSGHDFIKSIGELPNIDMEEIQIKISIHVKKQYINVINTLVDSIIQNLDEILAQLKVVAD